MNKKAFFLIAVITACMLVMCSCTRLPISGQQTLTVKTCRVLNHKSILTFKELKGEWVLPTDTLAPGKTVVINFINNK
jgi:hypothetical protein